MTTTNAPDLRPDKSDSLRPPNARAAPELDRYPFFTRQVLQGVSRLVKGVLSITMPDDGRLCVEGREHGPSADIQVLNLDFARKLARGGEIGFAESYLDGDWETSDLTRFLELFCINRDALSATFRGAFLARALQMAWSLARRNTRAGSRRNIHSHYDLGNDFYAAWLDPTMTYSAALFADGDDDLERAQVRKYRTLAESLQLRPDMRLLEIGCGWGGFATFAAHTYGCRVRALTISAEQFDLARRRAFETGLAERVDIVLQDYRDERGEYDRIASIEMFEAVGESYWPVWFDQLRDRLVAGGRAAMQSITIDEAAFPSYRRNVDFIRRYIFPGGMLPSGEALRALSARAGLDLCGELAFGRDYGLTLAQWRNRFRSAWPKLRDLGFDERFRRLWEYYLAYCEAGFRTGLIDVRQLTFVRE